MSAPIIAAEAAKKASAPLTGDIVQIRSQFFREAELDGEKVLIPIDVEAHVNPLTILLGGGAAAVGALAAVVAWNGIEIPTPLGGKITLIKGLKETTLGKDLNTAYERIKRNRRIKASGGEIVEVRDPSLPPAEREDPECELLGREYQKAIRRGARAQAAAFLNEAKKKGCLWPEQV